MSDKSNPQKCVLLGIFLDFVVITMPNLSANIMFGAGNVINIKAHKDSHKPHE